MNGDRYRRVRDEIAEAAIQSGRNPEAVSLVAVTKEVSWDLAAPLYDLGQRDFGENRVAQALEKRVIAPEDCRWHLIGTLQTNKVRKAIGCFALIHSVDTVSLARKLSQCSQEIGMITPILLQANTSGELTKHGLTAQQWREAFDEVCGLPALSIEGLMTIAPLGSAEREARECFATLRALRESLKTRERPLAQLSMGMSGDFKWAIAEGATIVRIGTALFG